MLSLVEPASRLALLMALSDCLLCIVATKVDPEKKSGFSWADASVDAPVEDKPAGT